MNLPRDGLRGLETIPNVWMYVVQYIAEGISVGQAHQILIDGRLLRVGLYYVIVGNAERECSVEWCDVTFCKVYRQPQQFVLASSLATDVYLWLSPLDGSLTFSYDGSCLAVHHRNGDIARTERMTVNFKHLPLCIVSHQKVTATIYDT